MKKLLILILMLPALCQAQKTTGKVVYEYKRDFLKFIERDTTLTKEEKSRSLQTWKNDEAESRKYSLNFDANTSYYQVDADEKLEYWSDESSFFIFRNFADSKALETQNIGGKNYIIEDQIPTYAWKIKSEIKEIGGYLCMLATTYDSLYRKNVSAWFTTEIPVAAGPEIYSGLPGLILEIDIEDGVTMITATSIKLDDNLKVPELPKKLKGKRYTFATVEKEIDTYIKTRKARGWTAWMRY